MRAGVLVPVHGFSPYLPEALDTVLAEQPDEVVVVDDGSPDALALHPDHAQHCRLVRRDQRSGPAAARQTGLQALGAEIEAVALCDADDAWTAGSLAPRLRALQDGADVAFGRAEIVGVDGQPTGEVWPLPAAGPSLEELYRANPLCTSSAIVRRATLEAAGGFATPLTLAEDWDLWLRLAAAGARFAAVPEAAVRYRRHPGGLTADVEALARAQHRLHARHAALVGGRARRRAQARDLAALADGLAARGAYREARVALRGSMRLGRVSPRSAARTFALAVPGIRARLGRRGPYP